MFKIIPNLTQEHCKSEDLLSSAVRRKVVYIIGLIKYNLLINSHILFYIHTGG